MLTRIAQRWVLVLARRLEDEQGRFIGVVYANIAVETYTAPVEAVTSETGKFLVPAMRINGFNFSSVTRF